MEKIEKWGHYSHLQEATTVVSNFLTTYSRTINMKLNPLLPARPPPPVMYTKRFQSVEPRTGTESCLAWWGEKGQRACDGCALPTWSELTCNGWSLHSLFLSAFFCVSIYGPVQLSLLYLVCAYTAGHLIHSSVSYTRQGRSYTGGHL